MPEKFRHQVSQLRRAGEAPPAGPRRPAGAPANRDFRGEAGDAGIQPPSRRPAPAGLLRAVHSRGGPGGARNASRGVPVPLAFRAIDCESSPDQLAEELLALTKMNWNQTQLNTRKPITLETSKRVGDILRRLPAGIQPQARYAFYMQPRGPGRADPPALRRAQSLASISHARGSVHPRAGSNSPLACCFTARSMRGTRWVVTARPRQSPARSQARVARTDAVHVCPWFHPSGRPRARTYDGQGLPRRSLPSAYAQVRGI